MKSQMIRKNIHGINVAYMKAPSLMTAYVGYHTIAGAYAETDENSGVAHYLEHMFFKGTNTLNWEDIAIQGSMLGGIQNASTSNYTVSYYLGGMPKSNLDGAVKLLSDMMFNSQFPKDEIESERTVILEEAKSYEDDHDSTFYGNIAKSFHNEQTRRKIIGTQETISNITQDTLIDYYTNQYGGNNTVLLIIGSMSENKVFRICEKYLKGNPIGSRTVDVNIEPEILKCFGESRDFTRAGIQQTYVAEVFRTVRNDEKKIVQSMVNHLIGGGMNSLLFKEVREKRGLCYSVGLHNWMSNAETGTGMICSSIDPSKLSEYREAVESVKSGVIENGFNEIDFLATKNAILGKFCRSIQSPEALASSFAGSELMGIDFDINKEYDACRNATLEDVNTFANEFLTGLQSNWAVMSPEV